MTTSSLAVKVETWLSSTWHVKVPAPWLEACIAWIQQENGSSSLTQAHINKQVFEQWLLTDLRDLEYPLLPDCILNAPKGELHGFYSIQIDSFVDVSQPAYSQLQKIRGKNTLNEEITANTQGTQKSWEAKPTRMLMLQLTDGIHHIQGMEYHPVPVLHSSLPPGTKVMIQGKVAYRLGVLLLKPENVRLLGGEVDSLVEENAEERVLARLIGEEDNPNPVRLNINETEISRPLDTIGEVLGPSDEELLASLEENHEIIINEFPLENGYCSRSTRIHSTTPLPPSNGSCLQQSSAISVAGNEELYIPVLEYTEGDFDEFPLDDDLLLEVEIQQEQTQIPIRSAAINNHLIGEENSVKRQVCSTSEHSTGDFFAKRNVQNTQDFDHLGNKLSQERSSKIDRSNEKSSNIFNAELSQCSDHSQTCKIKNKCHKVGLETLPFTYLSVLLNNKPSIISVVKVKAFIVTLIGNLTNSNGFWNITAKISDGTAYLEVDFADEILTSLIGFSVPEMKQMKKDPALHSKLREGLQNCQRELIDLCCLMTIEFNPYQTKAIVIVLQDINVNDLNTLKRRLNTCSI
ncbi:recQ-mediated genome instability protein 1 [Hemicordylus capensis]|uniref:recQ-mediated genome instability protein 1 n=1 Tax=Hemicordylus capensis TaxID=884348 RepID=UPI002303EB1A|nr:recQ-mediated genome instability protein 1 [Hemicordylus capensis]XP_053149922.1 recQ-mediated genome instability protein 1 [Hemicordylus capensis]